MSPRTDTTAAQLYLLLNREFTRRQSRRCPVCAPPVPFRVDRLEPQAPNWEVLVPPDCGGECADLLRELVAEFQILYELVPSDDDENA
jgi:hypothetical protein